MSDNAAEGQNGVVIGQAMVQNETPPGVPRRRCTIKAEIIVIIDEVGILPIVFIGGGDLNTVGDAVRIMGMGADSLAQRMSEMGFALASESDNGRSSEGEGGEDHQATGEAVTGTLAPATGGK